ncbi:hypothetical protein CRG98_049809 [Punica granatum]|uniref:Peptidase C1A papain C-terminal domain-containing protein n=1 Tax=Punica granatum TaxID=22663 RepID=A0A2I0H1V5_PUNGR|nr:hypothetical protein CRG98_049809 [Punica granatum]
MVIIKIKTGCMDKLDHAMDIIGYGTSEDETKYWFIRNSWGPSWGEGSYMKIAREVPSRSEGVCGLP